MKFKKYLNITFKSIFLIINLLFVYKYGLRQSYIPAYPILVTYSVLCGSLLYKDIFEFEFIRNLNLKKYYFLFCFLIFFILLLITFYTDGYKLNVDRWSAMETTINALMNGKYPYTATDHLNGRSSNFPGLLIIGIPFYMLGNVGYLQVFAFLMLSYTLYKYLEIEKAFRYILLLIISPAYWWEIFAISDLLSNLIIAFCFILLLKVYFKENIFKNPVFLGFSTSFLVLTRGIVAIPLILLVFKSFWKITTNCKIKYTLSFLTTFVFLIIIVLFNCPSINTLKLFNPFTLQTSYLPWYIHLLALVLPFYFSFKINNFKTDFFKSTSVLMLFPSLFAIISTWINVGFQDIILKSSFDLSYFTMVFPFLLIEIIGAEKNLIDRN